MVKDITIHFENASAMCLYYLEMEGQISDGKYENSRPYDHWRWVTRVTDMIVDGNKGLEGDGVYSRGMQRGETFVKKYNLNEWFTQYIKRWRKKNDAENIWATRIIAYGKLGKIFPGMTYKQLINIGQIHILLDYLQGLIEARETNVDIIYDMLVKYISESFKDYLNEECLALVLNKDFIEKFVNLKYDIKECKADCKSMYDSINTVYNK